MMKLTEGLMLEENVLPAKSPLSLYLIIFPVRMGGSDLSVFRIPLLVGYFHFANL